MKGILYKWTNYVKGWQPRYFIIEDDTLAYYRSAAEVGSGCNGMLNLNVCDIFSCFEIIIPGKLRYCLKASSREDRQKWILAIGCVKAGSYTSDNGLKAIQTFASQLETKQVELKIYEQLLVDQLKELCSCIETESAPDTQHIKNISNVVEGASSTFFNALSDLMSTINITSSMMNEKNLSLHSPSAPSNSDEKDYDFSHFNLYNEKNNNENELPDFSKDLKPCNCSNFFRRFHIIDFSSVFVGGVFSSDIFLAICRRLLLIFGQINARNSLDNMQELESGEYLKTITALRTNFAQQLITLQNVVDRFKAQNTHEEKFSNTNDLAKVLHWEYSRKNIRSHVENEKETISNPQHSFAFSAFIQLSRTFAFTSVFVHRLFSSQEWNPIRIKLHKILTNCHLDDEDLSFDDDLTLIATDAFNASLRQNLSPSERVYFKKILWSLPRRMHLFTVFLLMTDSVDSLNGTNCTKCPAISKGFSSSDHVISRLNVLAEDARLFVEQINGLLLQIETFVHLIIPGISIFSLPKLSE